MVEPGISNSCSFNLNSFLNFYYIFMFAFNVFSY